MSWFIAFYLPLWAYLSHKFALQCALFRKSGSCHLLLSLECRRMSNILLELRITFTASSQNLFWNIFIYLPACTFVQPITTCSFPQSKVQPGRHLKFIIQMWMLFYYLILCFWNNPTSLSWYIVIFIISYKTIVIVSEVV